MEKKHVFTLERRAETYCDDPYCTGHINDRIVCSCGWDTPQPQYAAPEEIEMIKIRHVLDAEGLM